MPGPTLVISHPPHAEHLNLAAAATLLDLSQEELRLKAQYQVPEIWLAEAKPAQAKGYARGLGLAGFRVAVVDAGALSAIPPRTPVTKLKFDGLGLELETAGGSLRLTYHERVLGVSCSPDQEPPFLDLYGFRAGRVQRVTVLQGTTDLRGLLAERRIGVVANMQTMISTCEKRFANLIMDRRLEKMRLRKRAGLPASIVEKRRGFSYATASLSELLESLEPGLGDIAQAELSSRLVLLTYVGEQG